MGPGLLCQSRLSRETEPIAYLFNRFILRNQLTQLWRLGSLRSAGHAGKLETQAGVYTVYATVLRQNSFFLREISDFAP